MSAAPTSTHAGTLRVVGLGDSVMAGFACDCDGPVSSYATLLADTTGRHVKTTDLGEDGATTEDLLTSLREDSRTRKAVADADVVLVTIGANDLLGDFSTWEDHRSCDQSCFGDDLDTMKKNLGALLDTIHALRSGSTAGKNDTVLVSGYWNIFLDGSVARSDGGQDEVTWSSDLTNRVNSIIRSAAQRRDMTYVDSRDAVQGHGRCERPVRAPRRRWRPSERQGRPCGRSGLPHGDTDAHGWLDR